MHQMNIRSFFKIYEKTQTLSQYWFAAQQKASRSNGKSLSCFTKYLEQNLRFKSEERG